jgi:hypothetical protein
MWNGNNDSATNYRLWNLGISMKIHLRKMLNCCYVDCKNVCLLHNSLFGFGFYATADAKSKVNFFSVLTDYVPVGRGSICIGIWDFSIFYFIEHGNEVQSASYPMGTGDYFIGAGGGGVGGRGKGKDAWNWPLLFIWYRVQNLQVCVTWCEHS